MRVVVTGASGNIGTAVLRALPADMEVTALCRRPPAPKPPYDRARWVSIDLAEPSAADQLGRAMHGADAVVHLAWAIQPVRNENAMHAINIGGTRAVLQAVSQARVGHLVHGSSLGAYAAGRGPVTEDWPTAGISTSAYSRQKAIAERAVDAFAASHPHILISRVRPTLVAQAEAAAEISALFLGRWVGSPRAITAGRAVARRIGRVPMPRGLQLQFVHADDVAAALSSILTERIGGAFNLAAETLDTAALADLLGTRPLHLPASLVRAAVQAGFAARIVPISPGWFDLAMQIPVMDCSRAERELGWKPQHSSAQVMTELLEALSTGRRGASPALQTDPTSAHP